MMRGVKAAVYTGLAQVALMAALVAPVDRTPLARQPFYLTMRQVLDTAKPTVYAPVHATRATWSQVNITPAHTMPMAGYAPRSKFTAVHDSLFAKVLTISNGAVTVHLVSVDLLLFPPALRDALAAKAKTNDILYLGATHTHNGVGGWHQSFAGRQALGEFDHRWLEVTATKMLALIHGNVENLLPATVAYIEADASEHVENRLTTAGKTDGLLRGLRVQRADGRVAMLTTYSAHATNIDRGSRVLSGDYPSALAELQNHEGTFGMFMAGMVGSHRFRGITTSNFDAVAEAAALLHAKIKAAPQQPLPDSLIIKSLTVPIAFGPSQLRLSQNWKLRDWAFATALAPLEGSLQLLQFGPVMFVATPVDFSGEVFATHHLQQDSLRPLVITSFNGDYNGYITHDAHYDAVNKEEVRAMNWVGPFFGDYFAEMLKELQKK
jgi:hypothetical protein